MSKAISIDYNPFDEFQEIEKLCFTNEPQKEIWLSCMIGGDDANRAYNESISLKLKGVLDIPAFSKAIDQLVQRHEALRATVSPDGETLIIYKNFPCALFFEDLSSAEEEEAFKQIQDFIRREITEVFDLKEGPLFKAYLHRISQQEYYFTIINHHIIGDGWSSGIILEDLSKLYNAFSKGETLSLPPAAQISDYVDAQENFKLTDSYKKTIKFWSDLYKEDIPTLDLPTDHPRPSPRSYKGSRSDYYLASEKLEAIKTLGAKNGSSLVTTLLAAFEVLLYKLTHQKNLVIGLPASGQAATGLDDAVGHCVNLLPLKTTLDPRQTFKSYLAKRRKEVLDAYDHQRITFGELLQKIYLERNASRVALVPVMFNMDMGMDSAVGFDGLQHELISNPRAFENFEIYLNVTGGKKGMGLEWSYNSDLFDATTIEKINEYYTALLEQVVADSDLTIGALTKENIPDTQFLKGDELIISDETTINTLFEKAVAQYSSNIAVSFENTSLTYTQLNDKVEQLASYFIEEGIRKGDVVAVLLDRSLELIISLLAILKAGAAYLPLDPDYPKERIAFMLKDAHAKLLLSSRKYQPDEDAAISSVYIEDIEAHLENLSPFPAYPETEKEDLAYLLYTSGSTGLPKGVMISHGNLANFLLSMQIAPGIKETDRLLAVTSISFDIAGLELYLPLIAGAEVVLAGRDATRDGRMLLDLIIQKKISIMQATPSTWQMLLYAGWVSSYPFKLLCGGEALPLELSKKLIPLCKELWNMYGPTETTIWSAVKKINLNDKHITIGKPIHNTQLYVMDENGKPINTYETGEIYIGGEGVAKGYYQRDALTAEKFVWNEYANAVLYRTGDLGKITDAAEMECLGRIDHQIKLRGYRIEPGEIENKTLSLEGINECVVLASEDAQYNKRLIAYITTDENHELGKQTWKDRWDALYDIGAKDIRLNGDSNMDTALLKHLRYNDEVALQGEEWLDYSLERIKEIGAKKIYEIGSGAGQLLFELAPATDFYAATDYVATAIDSIHQRLAQQKNNWEHVIAKVAAADDFSLVKNASIDLVLINSVVQYFPDGDYLLKVLKKATAAISHEGCVFIGDVKGKSTLEMYHAMDYLSRASDLTTVKSFKEVVANRVHIEEELVIDPGFFYLLPTIIPRITGVDIQLKKGRSVNETTKYHYDVWLYVDKQNEKDFSKQELYWEDLGSVAQLESALTAANSEMVIVRQIPNARTTKDYKLQQLLKGAFANHVIVGIKDEVSNTSSGIYPRVFWLLADKTNYNAHIRWTTDGTDGLFDVIFIKHGKKFILPDYPQNIKGSSLKDFVRIPKNNEVHISDETKKKWKEQLQTVLPAYMLPDDFIALKKFPQTPNGKIDRKALPKPLFAGNANRETTRSLTHNEQLIADIWTETLGLENLKPTDDFFQLGGHSLLAVKVMVALETKTQKKLTIATIFEHSTIEKLAELLTIDDNADNTVKGCEAVVALQPKGTKTPLFFVHGADLNVILFKTISEYMDADQPVYGIQALGISGETTIPDTLEDISKRYIEDMLKVQPTGAYAIAGYSMGGFIAFEIAHQLKMMGKQIKFLGIIDTFAGNDFEGAAVTQKLKKIKHEANKLAFLTRSMFANPKESLQYQIGVARHKFKTLFYTDGDIPKEKFTQYEIDIYKKYSDALENYRLSKIDSGLTLFAVQKRLYYVKDINTLGWDRFVSEGVTTYPVAGDHISVLYPPYNKDLAAAIQKALNNLPDTQ